ncbi:MAG: RNA 2'-phosphotransferase [Lachnospiraceae bacterium]|jgi:putative RNA 2'-phosphotransferase|nr:RNA 2'-phosphotransferase [Lachnospiraceae bacterium]MCH4030871.1 RNA 2'-phosphotransferase [Lachnospiraceae bacterium]MCH4070845.1 RNA 2'-phosphotransferase [Lachnospiraceae bacterium]MCH4106981.1 RNA 2'-phosphotransferase [Lachnospiraceae bacterium]MCI1302165.1 RNA 2'-phosphotransferase [Lachnospiraceae bacterium]
MDDSQVKFISKKMSYALRHNPDKYGIRLDEEGFTDLRKFLRRDSYPAILQIDAAAAHAAGIRFYIGNDTVWLSDPIPPEYIKILV